jgi:hypothetical protein
MPIQPPTHPGRRAGVAGAIAMLCLAAAVPAEAQFGVRQERETNAPFGERYHVEVGGTIWNPSLFGVVSSEQFGIIGSNLDFAADLGYEQTRFRDLRIVLRPGKKHRFRAQYTPVVYTADTSLRRNIVFNGISFPVTVPLTSTFGWKVWRLGYEFDFLYKERGFVGLLLEGRLTDFSAELASPGIGSEYTRARGPLPAIGVVARAYPLREVAINFEVSGFSLPDIDPKYQANYFDWDIHGTINLTNYFGFQVGWRKMSTFLAMDRDKGDLKFQGMWFGGAVRY